MTVQIHLYRHPHCSELFQSVLHGIGWISEWRMAYSHSLIRRFHRIFSFPSFQHDILVHHKTPPIHLSLFPSSSFDLT